MPISHDVRPQQLDLQQDTVDRYERITEKLLQKEKYRAVVAGMKEMLEEEMAAHDWYMIPEQEAIIEQMEMWMTDPVS